MASLVGGKCRIGVGVLGVKAGGGLQVVSGCGAEEKAINENRLSSSLVSRRTAWVSHTLGLPLLFLSPDPSIEGCLNGPHPFGEGRGASRWIATVGSELGRSVTKVVVVVEEGRCTQDQPPIWLMRIKTPLSRTIIIVDPGARDHDQKNKIVIILIILLRLQI
jgi:hypothetical protein